MSNHYATHQNRRYSDSSQYDEVCEDCGLTDAKHASRNMDNTPCPEQERLTMHKTSAMGKTEIIPSGFTVRLTETQGHPCPPPKAGWYAGRDEEVLTEGPFETKEQAITEALCQEAFQEDGDEVHLYVGKYRQRHVDLSRYFDVHQWLEYTQDQMEDEDGPDPEGDRHPLEELSKEDITALGEEIKTAIWHWQRRRGIKLKSYWLDAVEGSGYVTCRHPEADS